MSSNEKPIIILSFILGITIAYLILVNAFSIDLLNNKYVKQTESIDNKMIKELFKECYLINKSEEQVKCVQNIISSVKRTEHEQAFLTPDKILIEGGVCRDLAVLQAAVFKDLGWNYSFNFPLRKHVFTTISTFIECEENNCGLYCNLEWDSYACYKLTF